jgi:alpha-amylase/alpha-mannosidase (GH57 family)
VTIPRHSVVIHGHFYQPPREDPWTGEVPRELSADPFHDWNERITDECYEPVTRARVLASDGNIAHRLNALEWISFDFGPTLLQWLQRAAPETYGLVLDADRRSRARANGHGNAIAQPYHHVILPLASRRDKQTEVRWGIADFERRFGRTPTGMWLPETAVDSETLDVLAAEGIAFTILAPHQVEEPPPDGLPGFVRTEGGGSIAVFVYDGEMSHGVAFGESLRDAEAWAERMAPSNGAAMPGRLVTLATDGETYGHHHEFGDLALAGVITALEARRDVRVDNFAAFLARQPAMHEIRLREPTSWSCAHGVERWRSDCGCKTAPEAESQQSWRTPLRDALERLARELHDLYANAGEALFGEPWGVRDGYGEVVRADADNREAFVRRAVARRPGETDGLSTRAGTLLEMERDALRMFTSCAWFFDDIGGLAPAQVLRYAAHAIDLAAEVDPLAAQGLEAGLLQRLADASSNDDAIGTGADLYRDVIRYR